MKLVTKFDLLLSLLKTLTADKLVNSRKHVFHLFSSDYEVKKESVLYKEKSRYTVYDANLYDVLNSVELTADELRWRHVCYKERMLEAQDGITLCSLCFLTVLCLLRRAIHV